MIHGRLLIVALAVSWLAAGIVTGQEWTRFRGPNGSGVSRTVIPTTWTQTDYVWRAMLPGIGHSSPVIWGDRLFVLSADPQTVTRYVICLSASDGSECWRESFPSTTHKIHVRNSFASTTPVVDQDHVYVAWAAPDHATLMALDHDGQIRWQRDLGPCIFPHGFGASPIVWGELVILPVQMEKPDDRTGSVPVSFVIAVDRMTGQTRWQTPRASEVASYSAPCIYESPDGPGQLICCNTADGLYSLDPSDGRVNWFIDVFTMRTVSSPIVASSLVLATTGSGGGGNYVVAVHPGNPPSVAYEIRRQAPYVPTPVAKDDLVFLWSDKGIVTCVRADDGSQVWQQRVVGDYSGSPVIAGDAIYCISDNGDVVVLAAKEAFQMLGRNALGEPSRSTPAVANGRMYLRTYSQLFAVGGARK